MRSIYLLRSILLSVCLTISMFNNFGQNPIISHIYTADPAALVQDDSVYIYTGHDEASETATFYNMNDWHVFSSADMVNWKDHGEVLTLDDFSWAVSNAWASHCIERDGKFYWYVTVSPASGGAFAIGVAVADSPTGPFTDAIGSALITDDMTPNLVNDIDPAVFIDDDGQAYLYWGNGGVAKVVKLKDNMIELDGEIIDLSVPFFTEAAYLHQRDSVLYYSYAGYWPETIEYAAGSNPLGPFTHQSRINQQVSSTTNHQSIIEFKNQWYFIYHTAELPGGGDYRRSVSIEYLFYDEEGSIREIVQTSEGVAHADSTSLCPPLPVIPNGKINDESWTESREFDLMEGDSLRLSPETGDEGSWIWTGPDNFYATTREIVFTDISSENAGTYWITYTRSCGTTTYMYYDLKVNPEVPDNIKSGVRYIIRPKNSELAVSVENAATIDGADIVQTTFTNTANQQWILVTASTYYWRLSPLHAPTKALDVNSSSEEDGAKVQLWQYGSKMNQQWQASEVEDSVYLFIARHSGKCLDADGTTTDDGAVLRQWTCNGSERQQFVLTVAGEPNSLTEPTAKNGIIVYPNPSANGTFGIDLSGIDDPERLEILNTNGRMLYSRQLIGDSFIQLNLGLTRGVYFVKVIANNSICTARCIIN